MKIVIFKKQICDAVFDKIQPASFCSEVSLSLMKSRRGRMLPVQSLLVIDRL